MRDRRGSIFHPGLIAVGMVAMMVRIKSKSDRFVRDRPDFWNDLFRPGGKVAINDEDVILKNDPAIVAVSMAFDIPFVEKDVRRKICNRVDLSGRRKDEKKSEESGHAQRHNGSVHGRMMGRAFFRVKLKRPARARPAGGV